VSKVTNKSNVYLSKRYTAKTFQEILYITDPSFTGFIFFIFIYSCMYILKLNCKQTPFIMFN